MSLIHAFLEDCKRCRSTGVRGHHVTSDYETAASSTFHNGRYAARFCRRPIEKSPLAQIQMSLSTIWVGEYWADDGDYDEPNGDRPDERIARSNGGGANRDFPKWRLQAANPQLDYQCRARRLAASELLE
jgi:hypothetical protein